MKILIAVILLLAGAIWCLFGYRLFRPLSALLGLVACGTSGYCIADYYGLDTVYVLLIAAFAGLLGGAIGFWLVKVHAFLAGLFCGMVALISLLGLITGNSFTGGLAIAEEHPVLYISLALAAGLLFGILCVAFFKPAILLLSAASGALLLTSQAASLLTLKENVPYIILGVAALIGILVQALSTGGLIHDKKDRQKKDSAENADNTDNTDNGEGKDNAIDSVPASDPVPANPGSPAAEPPIDSSVPEVSADSSSAEDTVSMSRQ